MNDKIYEMGLYVYILKCADDSFYVGVTNNVESRVLIHNTDTNLATYTHSRRPVIVVWYNYFESNMKAIKWKKKLKGWTRKKKQALIESKYELLHDFSKCKNESSSKNFVKLE